jgi:type IV pilus assembly protein PilV
LIKRIEKNDETGHESIIRKKSRLWGVVMNFLKKAKGFTLIEVLVALVIRSISLLALAGFMVTTTKNNASEAHMTEAATFAQDKLEELRMSRWENTVSGSDQKKGSTGINYSRNWTITETETGDLRTITLTINWSDRFSHSIRFFSVIAR